MKEWLELQNETKLRIFEQISIQTGLPESAVEKDWWVTHTLKLIFSTQIAAHTVFKGGTSLSKAWGLIDRFSEDIDLALDRKFLGFGDDLSNSQVRKLRLRSFQYISETFFPELVEAFAKANLKLDKINLADVEAHDQDPLIIEVYYPSITKTSKYIQPRVLVEIGSRSLMEPHSQKSFSSLVGEYFKDRDFADESIIIPVVNPERTFLEKIFLLHEEFQKTTDRIRVNRLSRHLYDIEKLMNTPFADIALSNKELYLNIVEHRKTITPVRGIDYANHIPQKINPLPPDALLDEWRRDYQQMQGSMIYKDSLPFDALLDRIKILKLRLNQWDF